MKQGFLNILPTFLKGKKQAYTSIKKLPISIWWEITEGGNYEKLVLSGNYSNMELYNIYLDLLQQYYDSFGSTEKHQAFVLARYSYAKALARYVSSQAPVDKMYLEMATIDLQEATPRSDEGGEEQSLPELITIIEKNFGFQLDEETLSTYKFYSYQKALRNG